MKWWKKPWVLPACLTVVILFGSNWYIKQIMHEDIIPKEDIKTRLEAMYQGTVGQLTEGPDGYEAEIMKNGALYSATVDHRTGKVQALTLLKEAPENLAAKPSDEISSDEKAEPPAAANEPDTAEKPAAKPDAAPDAKTEPVPLPKAEKPAEQQKPAPQPQPQKPQQQAKPPVQKQPAKPQPAPKKSVILTQQQAVNIALKRLNAKVPVEVDDVDFVKTQEGGYYLVELDLDTDDDYDEVTYQIHAISGKIMSETWDD